MRRGLVLIALLFLCRFVEPSLGAIYPKTDNPTSAKHFPSYNFSLAHEETVVSAPISIQMAKNEHYLFFLELSNLHIKNDVEVRLKPPSKVSNTWLRADVFQLRAVFPEDLPSTADLYADGLVPLDSELTVQMNPSYLAVRLTTTHAHPSGIYPYLLTIQEGTKKLDIPLQIKVWPISLPKDLPITIEGASYYNPSKYSRYGLDPQAFDRIFPSYLAALREYRINAVASVTVNHANMIALGQNIEDYPDLTQRLDDLFNKFGFGFFRLPKLTGQYDAINVGTTSDLFSGVAPGYYQKWLDYMSDRGWAHRVLVRLWDEPTTEELPRMAQAYNIIKDTAPDFKTETSADIIPTDELVGALDIYSYFLDLIYDPAIPNRFRSKGIIPWLYANARHKIPYPPTHQRSVGWYLFQRDFSGYSLWSVNFCELNPWSNPPRDDSTDNMRSGTLLYPHRTRGTPVPSLRLEALRRGLEDYLYLDLLEKKRNTVPAAVWKDIVDSIEGLIFAIGPDGTWNYGTVPGDWSGFEAVRIKIGELLSEPTSGNHASLWKDGRVTDLGTLGGSDSWATALDNSVPPRVVGASTSSSSPYMHAFIWQDGHMKDLGMLDGDQWSSAEGINDNGQIVGTSGSSDPVQTSRTRACRWTVRNGQGMDLIELGTLGGRSSYAYAINSSGQIVGESQTAGGDFHAFLWTEGVMSDLGVFTPHSINDLGQVAGTTPDGSPVLWENGTMRILEKMGGDFYEQTARSISEAGQIVGSAKGSSLGLNYTRAFLWDGYSGDIGTPSGLNSYAQGVNSFNSIKVVGFNTDRYPEIYYNAFLYRNGQLTDLGPGGAYGVNNQGEAAGYARLPSGGLTINNNEAHTTSPLVTLKVFLDSSTKGVVQMRFSNNPGEEASWSDWRGYSSNTIAWKLSPAQGLKTVAVQFKDASGLVSYTAKNSIILDTAPPMGGKILINNEAKATNNPLVTITPVRVTDASGLASVFLSNDGAAFTEIPCEEGRSVSWNLNEGLVNPVDGLRTVYAKFRDQVGLTSTFTTSATILLDTVPPRLAITINDGSPFANKATVIVIAKKEDLGGSPPATLFLTNRGDRYTEEVPWQDPGKPLTISWNLNKGLSSESQVDGPHMVYAKLREGAGNTGTSQISVTLDRVNPTGSIRITNTSDGGDQYTPSPQVILHLNASDSTSGVDRMQFSNDFGVTYTVLEPYATSKAWTLPDGDGTKRVKVRFTDKAGNVTYGIVSNIIKLDTTKPVGRIKINDGGPFTNSRNVSVTSIVRDTSSAKTVSLSNDNINYTLLPYQQTVPWKLSPDSGPKTVYARFTDQVGYESATVSDDIFYTTDLSTAIALSRRVGPPTVPVTVTGTNFGPLEAVDIFLNDVKLLPDSIPRPKTDGVGAFSADVVIPAQTLPGLYSVIAIGMKSGRAARESFSVHGNWTHFHGDAQHTGWNLTENILNSANAAKLTLAWQAQTSGAVVSSPVVVNGMVYLGSTDGKLYVFDAVTGQKQWDSGTVIASPLKSSPAQMGSVVYAASTDGRVYAFNSITGVKQWDSGGTISSPIKSSPAVRSGILYVGSSDGKLYALDMETGTKMWDSGSTISAPISSSPAAGSKVWVTAGDSQHAFTTVTGTQVWNTTAGGKPVVAPFQSSSAVADDMVYAGFSDGKLYAFDAFTGSKMWDSGNAITAPIHSSPAVANSVVFVGADDKKLYAFNAFSGTKLWDSGGTITGSVHSSPAVANGIVFVGSDDRKLYAFDATSGVKLWDSGTSMKGAIVSSPAVVDGYVFVGSEDGRLYAFHLAE